MTQFDVIVFDIGGVLVELGGIQSMTKWSRQTFDEPELWRRWLASSYVRGYELGECTAHDFAQGVIKEFELDVEEAEFLTAFDHFVKMPFPGAHELLATLRENNTVVSLSNTNEAHWHRVVHEMKIADAFEQNFPSHITKTIKPDPEAFQHVIDAMGYAPERMLFLDDNILNVQAAEALGIHAVQVHGIDGARKALNALGIAC